MKSSTTYTTHDGKRFNNLDMAVEHEANIELNAQSETFNKLVSEIHYVHRLELERLGKQEKLHLFLIGFFAISTLVFAVLYFHLTHK